MKEIGRVENIVLTSWLSCKIQAAPLTPLKVNRSTSSFKVLLLTTCASPTLLLQFFKSNDESVTHEVTVCGNQGHWEIIAITWLWVIHWLYLHIIKFGHRSTTLWAASVWCLNREYSFYPLIFFIDNQTGSDQELLQHCKLGLNLAAPLPPSCKVPLCRTCWNALCDTSRCVWFCVFACLTERFAKQEAW